MGSHRLYTKEILESMAVDSLSVADVMRKLGFRVLSGGSHYHVSKLLKKFEINTSHFTGCSWNKGKKLPLSYHKDINNILVILPTGSYRKSARILRRCLLQTGKEHKCYVCCLTTWNDKSIVLEIEHKNGNCLDNRLENLEFICPNCHSQTATYGSKNLVKYG